MKFEKHFTAGIPWRQGATWAWKREGRCMVVVLMLRACRVGLGRRQGQAQSLLPQSVTCSTQFLSSALLVHILHHSLGTEETLLPRAPDTSANPSDALLTHSQRHVALPGHGPARSGPATAA